MADTSVAPVLRAEFDEFKVFTKTCQESTSAFLDALADKCQRDRDLLEKQLNRLAAADASTQVVLHRLPIVPREGARALQARVDGLLAQVPGAPRVSVDRRMGAGGPVVLRVALPRDVHALMHVQNHPSVRHAGVYFTPFLTDADMDAHRALRPVLAELRDCGYPDAKLRNGKILAKDRNGAVRFLGAAGAQAWIRAASAASGPGPRAPGSSEGSRGGGATGAGAAGPASAGPPPAAAPLSRPAAPHAPPPPPTVQPPQAAAGAGQPAVRAPQRKSRKQRRGGGSGGSIGAPGQAVRAAQAAEATRAASVIAEIQGTRETRAAASQLRQTSRANASATAIHEQAAQHAPAQAMHQPTPTPPVAADEAPAPPSLPEEPAGAAEVAPTRAVVAAAASAAAVPSIGDKRSVGVAFTPPRERRSFLERAVQLVETVFSPGAEPPAQRPALLSGGSEQLPDQPRVSAQRALFTAQAAAAGVAPVAQPQLALAAPAAAQAVLSQPGGSVGTDSMPSYSEASSTAGDGDVSPSDGPAHQ